MNVDFSSCFSNVVSDFLLNKINFAGGDKLLPVFKHGFLRFEENVFPAIFIHTKCVWENIFIYNFNYLCMVGSITIHVGRCYCLVISNTLVFVADVIALADVIAMFVCCFFYWGWCFYLIIYWITCINKCKKMLKFGWWYCHYFVADVSNHWGRCYYLFVHARLMLLPIVILCGRCCATWFIVIFELADVIVKWLMELPLHDSISHQAITSAMHYHVVAIPSATWQ